MTYEHDTLFKTFEESPYGQTLIQNTRFNVFKPDFVGTEMWSNLLGADVNNLHHMPHTLELAETFSIYQGLPEKSRRLLGTVAITHDWGEALIGDIPLPSKTDEDEKREKIAYRQIAVDLLGDEQGEELTDKVWKVLSHEDEQHGDMFRAIEYVGYCSTAMRAQQVGHMVAHGFIDLGVPRDQKEQVVGGLLGLHKAVETHNFSILREYMKKYPAVGVTMWEQR